ncbi:endogenous inhibitor of DNA gyrase (YacG/DUF329 family) [Streptomyces luteogriseus]|uniref:Endogenous inhibitor of DNA gyrase (YacG/DUF329 family) n=1 Tax=Streptomyces luteogriseus TaxID=68233 RepID=A0A7W7DK65_9ACTN|nr:hypothetical protein [Streptomyces luteogriseus]MBB4711180.1 endogenous inhibitor of DNA gyrase (YacG/DUF329 family) [Streptomyces luteogriseus]
MHFHCPDCHPQLQRGVTPAICGATIPLPIAGNGPERKCPACARALRQHKASHKRGR